VGALSIIKPFDVVEHIRSGFFASAIPNAVDPLPFQQTKEALCWLEDADNGLTHHFRSLLHGVWLDLVALDDPVLGKLCDKTLVWNRRVYWTSVILWVIGFIAVFLALPLRIALDY
jgi:hypothetical protein